MTNYEELLKRAKKEYETGVVDRPVKSAGATSYENLQQQAKREYAEEQIRKNGNAFVNNLNSLLGKMQSGYDQVLSDYSARFEGRTGSYKDSYLSDSSDALQGFTARRIALNETTRQIEDILNIYGEYMDPNAVSELRQGMKENQNMLKGIGEGYSGSAEFFGQFADENEYAQWQDTTFRTGEEYFQDRLDWYDDATERVKTLTGAEKEALQAEITRYERGEGEWATYDKDTKLQTGFRNLESDRQLAKLKDKGFVDSAKKTAETSYIPSFEELAEMDKLLYDQNFTMDLGPDGQTVAYSSVDGSQLIMDKDGNFHHAMEYDPKYTSIDRLGVYLSADSDQKAKTSLHGAISTWDNIKNQGIANHWDFLTPEEVSVYYGLKAQSASEADAYLQQMQSTLNHRYENARAKDTVEQYERSNWLERVGMQAFGIGAKALTGLGHMVVLTDAMINGKEIDAYSATYSGTRYARAIRGAEGRIWDANAKAIAASANDALGTEFTGKILGLNASAIFDSIMSSVDSMALNPIPVLGRGFTAASASADDLIDKYAQGASRDQMIKSAINSFAIELATESLGYEKLKLLKQMDVYTWGDVVMNQFKKAGVEGLEEGSSYIFNGIADAINRKSQSDWAKIVKKHEGDPAKVAGELFVELWANGLGGVIAGLFGGDISSIRSTASNVAKTGQFGKAIKATDGGVEGMKDYASTVAQNGNNKGLNRFASKLTDKSSNARVGKAYRMTEASVREQNKAELSKTLQEKGYSKKQADQIAEAAVSSAAGWRLTEKQQSIWSAAQSDPDVVAAVKDALTGEDSGVRRRNQMSEDFREGVRNRNMANSQTVGNAPAAESGSVAAEFNREVRRQMRENGLPVEDASGVEDPSTALRSAQDDSVSQEESDLTSPEMRQTMQEAYANDEITEEEYDDYLDAMMEQQGMDGVVEEEAQLREKAEAVKRAEEQEIATGTSALAMTDDNGGANNGTGVLHGSGQRNDRASAGEPVGGLAGRAGQDQARGSTKADRARETVYRQNLKQNLRDEPAVSSRSQGVQSGTDNATFKVVPEDMHSAKMREDSEDAYRRTGKRITYVVGPIEVVGKDGKVHNAKGVTTDDGILVRIDHGTNGDRIAEHEVFHGLMDLWDESAGRRTILDGLMDELRQRYDPEQLRQMLNQYKEALRGIYSEDSGTELAGDVLEDVDYDVLEEMLADAYAGLNEHGAGANRLTDTVRTWLRENHVEQDFFQDNGTEQPTGPPDGQKENTADVSGVRYSLDYADAIDQLYDGSLDRSENTHLEVLDHTPDVYIKKAGAKNLRIITGWDIAYLGMHKSGDIPGNYHGLGPDVMKQIPNAIQDPLYIIKQQNGRIAAITEIVVKKNRSVIVSIEFDSFKSTKQDGSFVSDNYNLILTFMDAKPNYLSNTIFKGDIVYNKNNESPANFILRLKSLNKALPNDDLAGPSDKNISYRIGEVKQQIQAVLDKVSPNHAAQMESYTVNKVSHPELAQKLYDGLMDGPYSVQFEEYLKLTEELARLDSEASAITEPETDKTGTGFVERASVDDSDQEYMDAVNDGDMDTAQRMVDEAAPAAGFDSPLLFHGTASFGFTEFDLSKMDDKRSIFLTDNMRIAATYSGVMGKREISRRTEKDVEDLTIKELVDELNSDQYGVGADADDKFRYSYLSLNDINQLINSVNERVEGLQADIEQKIEEYSDKMAADFNDADQKVHGNLVKLSDQLRGYKYDSLSSTLYMLLHHTDVFNSSEETASRIAELERDIRLMNKLKSRDNSNGVIVESWLSGYSLSVLDENTARDRLEVKRKTGNYGMYAKTANLLVIDAEGAVWNDIRHWSGALDINMNNTRVERSGEEYLLIDQRTGKEIPEGAFAVNVYSAAMPESQLHNFMLSKAQSAFSIITENMNTTRDISKFALEHGYSGVKFRNLRDNGGRNAFVGTEELADIYVIFDPTHVKSADPVTYDAEGNVIPLSERFKESKKDFRYSIDDSVVEEEQKDSYSTLPAKARDYVRSAERNLLDFVGQALSVPKAVRRDFLAQVVRAITNEYLTNGSVSAQTIDSLFQQAYAQGVVADKEFFNQYEHIKDHLRSTAVTLAEQDRSDIADFTDFKRQAGGLLKIRNEGGLPVDVAYQELQDMAPELFPDNITHPADQLVRMLEVAQSIEVSYMSLDRYYGDDAANFKRDARHEFENAVDKVLGDLRNAKRYMDDRNAERDKAPTTVEEAMEAWKELKAARRNYEKTMAKNLLTEHDQRIVGDLLYGKATLENLDPERDNVKGITAVYEAKREYAKLVSLLAEYKRNLKAELRAEADSLLETANEWKDKSSGLAYSRETMRRNVLDIVKDPEVADKILRKYIEPVAIAEAAATRFKDKYRERVAALNLSRKVKKGDTVSEAHAVQLLGEAMDNIAVIESARGRLKHRDGKTLTEWKAVVQELWESSPSLDRAKIEKAVQEFREIYDDLFQQMNQVRVQNGYEPVNYRKGYFPHFQKESTDGILAHFGRALGISTEVAALPTTINGLTHTFRPGIQWFGNALQRTGFATAYDAVEGFDKYIEGVASVIHQTENIQRLRALASQIRYRTSDEGIRAQVDKVLQDERLTEEEKHNQINSIYEHGRFSLSGFVVELDEYTNLLANKKSRRDREIESDLGRRFYNVAKWLEQRIAANMIAGNLSSALTNVIPLTQAAARMDRGYLVRGMWNTLKAYKVDDGMVETSTFLTNRRGSDPLIRKWQDKVSNIAGLPMELIDQFVADSIVRGAYYQNLKRGLTEEEALHQADLFAASVMADRSKGAMPTIFSATNPGTKLFTMFQLEVNNQFSEVFKDMPREMRSKGKLALAAKLLQYVLGAFLFNELFEALFGRRPALDPIGILNETIGDFSGYELPNLLELISGVATGNVPSFKTEKAGVGQSILNLGENILGELPFNSALGLVGIGEDSRIPVESALPDVTKLINAATNSEWAPEKRWRTAVDEVVKPVTYLALPFGGNQLSKTVKGVIAAVQGGSYTVDNKGRDILQYPVFDDPFSVLRAAIMGKNSVPEGQDWVDDGFDSLSAKATATYQGILDVGVDDREAYALVDELRHAKKTDGKTKENVQRDILRDSDISAEAKVVAYCGMVATESELKWMNRLLELNPDAQSVFDVAVGLKEADALKGDAVRQARAEAIADTVLTEAQKIVAVESFLGNEWQNEDGKPTTYAKFRDMLEAGLTVDDFMELYAAGLDSSGMDKFLKYVDSGLNANEAAEMLKSVSALKPAEGKTTVSNVQKWRAAVDSQSGTEDQLTALSAVMDEKTYQKVELANGYGVKPDAYVGLREILPKYDEDGNSSYNQKEIAAAVNAVGKKMNLTTEQKAVLWQIMASTKSAKNNPYSVEIGWKVVDALSDETLSFGEMFMRQVMANM